MPTPSFKITWIDRGREPQNPPDPAYPNGKPIDATGGKEPNCLAPLFHPAPRCGYYHIQCLNCGVSILVTTAGRVDDPSSVRLACRAN